VNWTLFLALVAKEGLPLALDLYDKWINRASDTPTAEEIADLKALASNTSRTQMLEALQRAGIEPDSEQGKKLLGLI